ncbi:unnamed protein product [Durusdinium trenchii]|uniref:Uncharacterized protein n=2 Tax=Durusdinium trenchii TaxID=1381693 RepID=A0ABP0KWE5_9DINO
MPFESDFVHAVDGLLSSWWGHWHEDSFPHAASVHASGMEHATEVPHHPALAASFLERPVQGSFLWTTEQLLQRRQQLRVAVAVESSIAASGTGLFVAKLMRILRRLQAEEEAKEDSEENEEEESEDEDDSNEELAPPPPQVATVRLNMNSHIQKGAKQADVAAAHL